MIVFDSVTKTYPLGKGNAVSALHEVSLEIARGEFVILFGRSGSGKTTLLNLAAGLTRPTSGKVTFEGAHLWDLSDTQQSLLRSQKIGFVFQFPSLLPALTVYDNMIVPTIFRSKSEPVDPKNDHDRAVQLLTKVGLDEKLAAYPRQLSAGQQQRVVIARALMNRPQVLLADEPTSNLDEKTEHEIIELFRDLHADLGITIMMVTHMRQLVTYGTRAIELSNGQIVNRLN
jgi:ABC-type lipoprotein export system ATPase subunit